jgi:hypothetical protein
VEGQLDGARVGIDIDYFEAKGGGGPGQGGAAFGGIPERA